MLKSWHDWGFFIIYTKPAVKALVRNVTIWYTRKTHKHMYTMCVCVWYVWSTGRVILISPKCGWCYTCVMCERHDYTCEIARYSKVTLQPHTATHRQKHTHTHTYTCSSLTLNFILTMCSTSQSVQLESCVQSYCIAW